jgi:hypothetical protein
MMSSFKIFKSIATDWDDPWWAYLGTVNAEELTEAIPRWSALHKASPGSYRAQDPRTGKTHTEGISREGAA